ncbi:MAG TPA: hypothetical protein VI546_03045 [candidate division Zixibacteria bacterium]|nr:hypothetical protein [candidate division Zixibacteria bacterium]
MAAPEGQESKEEPSLAAFAERDEAVKGDTVLVTAGKNAEIRKEVATSQVKVAAEEIEKLQIRNVEDSSKIRAGILRSDTRVRSRIPIQRDTLRQKRLEAHYDSVITKLRSQNRRSALLIDSASCPLVPKASVIDTAQLVAEIRQIIFEKEEELRIIVPKAETESLYIYLAQFYVQLYRFSLEQGDWEKADQRLTDFLKTDLSESARRWLVATQAELKKLKK